MNAIDLEVIYQSTLQIARELTLNMLRTGYSTIIKESQDFTFAIFDAQGRMVAQGIPQPLHIGPLTAQVNEIRRRFRDDIEPGDAFIVNHPYQACQNHATDVTVISPVFVRDRIAAYIGNIAHKPDLGGKVPGTNSGDATDLFQEGLLIPPPKILRRGKMNEDVQNLICANTRTPEVTWGDIRAQVNTSTYGSRSSPSCSTSMAFRRCRRAGSAGWISAKASCAARSPRFPMVAMARKPTTSTTTASTSTGRIASR